MDSRMHGNDGVEAGNTFPLLSCANIAVQIRDKAKLSYFAPALDWYIGNKQLLKGSFLVRFWLPKNEHKKTSRKVRYGRNDNINHKEKK